MAQGAVNDTAWPKQLHFKHVFSYSENKTKNFLKYVPGWSFFYFYATGNNFSCLSKLRWVYSYGREEEKNGVKGRLGPLCSDHQSQSTQAYVTEKNDTTGFILEQ